MVLEVLVAGSCSAVTSKLHFSNGALSGCEATLSCESVQGDIDGGPSDETVFTLTSDGVCGQGPEQASRSVQVRVR